MATTMMPDTTPWQHPGYRLDLTAYTRISWYPGHMLKAQREIAEKLPLIDVVLIVVDARIPLTSWNPELQERIGTKQRIVILSKTDLAEPAVTRRWLDCYRDQNMLAMAMNCAATGERPKVIQLLQRAAANRTGVRAKLRTACRVMVIGVPNVGKSSLINTLAGSNRARTGPMPGLTRQQQWVPIEKDFELLDTPGVMMPRIADGTAGLRLGLVAAIKDRICGEDHLAYYLFHRLNEAGRLDDLAEYYDLGQLPADGAALLDHLASRWGFLQPGGIPDRLRAANRILQDFRSGHLGPLSLEMPPNT